MNNPDQTPPAPGSDEELAQFAADHPEEVEEMAQLAQKDGLHRPEITAPDTLIELPEEMPPSKD